MSNIVPITIVIKQHPEIDPLWFYVHTYHSLH